METTLKEAEKRIAALGHESWLFALPQQADATQSQQSALDAELRLALGRALLACEQYALLRQRTGKWVLTVKEGAR